jgi:hypothetical protein
MTGFLIELRSSGYPEQPESKLQYIAEGWCRARETRTSRRRTPLRTCRRSAQRCSGAEWVGLRRDGGLCLCFILIVRSY